MAKKITGIVFKEGQVLKGGLNTGPSQITKRPPPPKPTTPQVPKLKHIGWIVIAPPRVKKLNSCFYIYPSRHEAMSTLCDSREWKDNENTGWRIEKVYSTVTPPVQRAKKKRKPYGTPRLS